MQLCGCHMSDKVTTLPRLPVYHHLCQHLLLSCNWRGRRTCHTLSLFSCHLCHYADDIQIYTYTMIDDAAFDVDHFAACLTDVEAWLRASQLRLNPTKTQVMWLGSSQQLAKLDITHACVLSSSVKVQHTTRDLGVVIDSQLSLSAHIAAVCPSGYYQLPQLRQTVWPLSENASKTLVQTFVSCRPDYCNSLFFGISEGLMNRRQSVQNAATRLVTGTRCSDHISPVLRLLHWLPVCQRTVFKVATLMHQSLSGIAPLYLAEDCHLVADVREWRLHSTASRTCVMTWTHSTFGDRAFTAANPGLCNSRPLHLKDVDLSYSEFRQLLKTFLFWDSVATAQCELVLTVLSRNSLTYFTYLLT